MQKSFLGAIAATLLVGVAGAPGAASALTLKEAMAITLESNPEIGQAQENREATEFELRQARGLYMPSVDLEAGTGIQRLDNTSRRLGGLDDDPLYPADVGISVTQKLFDGGARRTELERQAARVDSASFRVLERSESIALQVVREYLEIMLQGEIVQESRRNMAVHQQMLGDINSLISGGTLTDADRQQAEERLLAAKVRAKEAEEELESARIRFQKLVGQPFSNPSMPGSMAAALPKSLDEAIGLARANNARIKVANADIDAADAMVKGARSDMFPTVSLEGRARTGMDIDGNEGRSTSFQARVVAKWNLYRGGIDIANEQEQIRRASEQRLVLHQSYREVEEAVRISWDRRIRQTELAATLKQQAAANGSLVASYREQLAVGRRSLLDVLGAQNSRYTVNVLSRTAVYAARFAEYRILAASGMLLSSMNLAAAKQSEAYARTEFNVPETAATETYRRLPSRQVSELPLDLLAPMK